MMRNSIEPSLQKIKEYFNRKEFYIPTYQRPYTWKVEQCEQLIEDINTHKEAFDQNTQDNYFFGAILIAQEAKEAHEVALIDGQQRTTTFMLLLKALLMHITQELHKLSDAPKDAQLVEQLSFLKNDIISMQYNLNDDDFFNYKRGQYELELKDLKYVNDSVLELHQEDMITILMNEDFDLITKSVKNLYGAKKRLKNDNKFTNFYRNLKFFYSYFKDLTNTQVRDFSRHFIDHCQVITITSFNTDQAINIFNSLNGTGIPLNPIEVIVSKTTANASDRKVFEANWKSIVTKTDEFSLDLNLLMTHYVFVKLSEQRIGGRNPGIKNFFQKNKTLLINHEQFTEDLDKILDNLRDSANTPTGQLLNKFNGNLKAFVSSYSFFRKDTLYLSYLLRLGVLLDLTDFSYGNQNFKGFLEKINAMHSQTDDFSDDMLIEKMKQHIAKTFDKEDIMLAIKEGSASPAIVYLNEYLFCKKHSLEFDLSANVEIEHIMPQSGKNRASIMKDAGFNDDQEFCEFAERLGNKILLESNINRSIGDAWFTTKKQYRDQGYQGSNYQIAKALAHYPKDTWTKEDIVSATDKAAKRIVDFIFE